MDAGGHMSDGDPAEPLAAGQVRPAACSEVSVSDRVGKLCALDCAGWTTDRAAPVGLLRCAI